MPAPKTPTSAESTQGPLVAPLPAVRPVVWVTDLSQSLAGRQIDAAARSMPDVDWHGVVDPDRVAVVDVDRFTVHGPDAEPPAGAVVVVVADLDEQVRQSAVAFAEHVQSLL